VFSTNSLLLLSISRQQQQHAREMRAGMQMLMQCGRESLQHGSRNSLRSCEPHDPTARRKETLHQQKQGQNKELSGCYL
jgi:hypothetical protein